MENNDVLEEGRPISFEQALEQLEQIVAQLEGGDVPLEKSISLFQQGMSLSNFCNQQLEQVEKKIEMLIDEDGQMQKQPFDVLSDSKGDQA